MSLLQLPQALKRCWWHRSLSCNLTAGAGVPSPIAACIHEQKHHCSSFNQPPGITSFLQCQRGVHCTGTADEATSAVCLPPQCNCFFGVRSVTVHHHPCRHTACRLLSAPSNTITALVTITMSSRSGHCQPFYVRQQASWRSPFQSSALVGVTCVSSWALPEPC